MQYRGQRVSCYGIDLHVLRTTMLQKFRGSRKFCHVIQGGLENPPSILFCDLCALCGRISSHLLVATLPR